MRTRETLENREKAYPNHPLITDAACAMIYVTRIKTHSFKFNGHIVHSEIRVAYRIKKCSKGFYTNWMLPIKKLV
jgi:hypothetical protein